MKTRATMVLALMFSGCAKGPASGIDEANASKSHQCNGRHAGISQLRTPSELETAFERKMPYLQACYFDHLFKDPDAEGLAKIRIEIDPEGLPESVHILHSDIQSPDFAKCLKKNVKKMRFCSSRTGQTASVVYPIAFRSR